MPLTQTPTAYSVDLVFCRFTPRGILVGGFSLFSPQRRRGRGGGRFETLILRIGLIGADGIGFDRLDPLLSV